MSRLRDILRRSAPPRVKAAVQRLKKQALGPSIFEVELGRYVFAPDPDPRPRLTLVIPTLARRSAFGGVTTGLDIFFRLALQLCRQGALDLRILQTAAEDLEAENAAVQVARRLGLDPSKIAFTERFYKGSTLPTRRAEIFVPYNWCCADNLLDVVAAQQQAFGGPRRPLVFPIQEYEPNFYAMSADQLLARQLYETDWPIHALVNSRQLADWLAMLGHSFARCHVFEPRLTEALRPFLPQAASATRKPRILVYGRTEVARNCFPIVKQGLQLWAKRHPEFAHWEVISAGAAHAPVPLARGRSMRSVGKLSLEDYARTLCETAVGLSLMASPHPSYPPLEMAHFGALTLTNGFANKDLSSAHDNLRSLKDARPEALAEALAETCREFEADPQTGARGQSHMPGYLSVEPPYPFMTALCRDLSEHFFGAGPQSRGQDHDSVLEASAR